MEWKMCLKGAMMGIADVIPGVSGGTLALILGIYTRFIGAIKSLDPRIVFLFLAYIASGLKQEKREALAAKAEAMDLKFLIPLAIGIFGAMATGSAVIPSLMDRYPEAMRGLFFGLILASVGVPWRMMPKENAKATTVGLLCAVVFAVLGYTVTDPNRDIDTTGTWVAIEADGEATLKELIRKGPSSLSTAEVYWADRNDALRKAYALSDPTGAQALADLQANAKGVRKSDKRARKAMSKHYDDIVVVDAVVHVPRPASWFVFLAGFIAISAMVLPGISGSFLLLILGCYYFVLNAVKGTLSGLLHFEFPTDPMLAVVFFACGCAVGLVGFSRVLSYLLRAWPVATFGALIGLMIGCLRGVWPWRFVSDAGALVNGLPETLGEGNWHALATLIGGAILALSIEYFGTQKEPKTKA